jgi:hypothetical protein
MSASTSLKDHANAAALFLKKTTRLLLVTKIKWLNMLLLWIPWMAHQTLTPMSQLEPFSVSGKENLNVDNPLLKLIT